MRKTHNLTVSILVGLLVLACLSGCDTGYDTSKKSYIESIQKLPEFNDCPYEEINANQPQFDADELTTECFEEYSELDSLGRCGVATACIGKEIMPTDERGEIGMIKPSGWHTVKYDFVDGKYLYNRCHLIAFMLAGENANEKNLITGTRYMNVEGMLPFENMVADCVKENDVHVMYRVTPVFDDNNLVARGVQMEAFSVEDNGKGVCFNVFCYNSQPGVDIDYKTGESLEIGVTSIQSSETLTYVLNTNNKKFHKSDCESVLKIKDKNKESFTGSRNELVNRGYTPCGLCKP